MDEIDEEAEQDVLTLIIRHEQPIELTDLALSLLKLGEEFQRFAQNRGFELNQELPSLYVREIRPGSVIVEMMALYKTIGAIIDHGKAIVDYAQTVKQVFDWFSGRTKDEQAPKLQPRI